MASPAIRDSIITGGTSASSSPVVNLPATVVGGDTLLVIFRSSADGAIGWPGGAGVWNELVDDTPDAATGQTGIAWKRADGTEGGTTITLSAGNEKFAAVAYAISGAIDPRAQAPEISTVATGSGTEPNANTVTPTGGSKDYLFLTAYIMEGEQTGVTTYPTGYTLGQLWADSGTSGLVTTNVTIGAAGKQATAASDDAGVWDVTGTLDDWSAYTIAFHPNIPIPAPLAFAASAMMSTRLAQPRRRTGIASRTIAHNHQTVLAPAAPVEGQGVQRLAVFVRSTPRSSTHALTITQNLLLSTLGSSNATLAAGTNTVTFTAPTATLVLGDVPFRQYAWPTPATTPRRALRYQEPNRAVLTEQVATAGANTVTFSAPTATALAEISLSAGANTVTFTAPLATLEAGGVPFVQSDWPLPQPRLRRGLAQVRQNTAVLTEQVVTAGANTVTFSAPTATSLAEITLAAGTNTVTFTAPGATLDAGGVPFAQRLWPRPAPRDRGLSIKIQTRPPVDGVVVEPDRPFVQSDWPLPRRAKTRRRDHVFYFVLDTYDPFTKYQGGQWANPARTRRRAIPFHPPNLITTTLAGTDQILAAGTNTVTFTAPTATLIDSGAPFPFSLKDWPNPRPRPRGVSIKIQTRPAVDGVEPPADRPFVQTDWLLPRRAKTRRRDHIFYFVLDAYDPFTKYQGGQWRNPARARGRSVPFHAPNLNQTTLTGGGGNQTLDAGVNTITFTAPTATVSATVTLSAGANTITFTAPSASVLAEATLAAGANTITYTAPTATALAETSVAAGANTVTFSTPTATLVAGDVSVAAGANTITFSAPTATAFAEASLSAGANTITLTAPTATAVAGGTSIVAGVPTIVFTAPFALLVDSNATPPARGTRYGYRYRYESREYQ